MPTRSVGGAPVVASTRPSRVARSIASLRLHTPSLRYSEIAWVLTVLPRDEEPLADLAEREVRRQQREQPELRAVSPEPCPARHPASHRSGAGARRSAAQPAEARTAAQDLAGLGHHRTRGGLVAQRHVGSCQLEPRLDREPGQGVGEERRQASRRLELGARLRPAAVSQERAGQTWPTRVPRPRVPPTGCSRRGSAPRARATPRRRGRSGVPRPAARSLMAATWVAVASTLSAASAALGEDGVAAVGRRREARARPPEAGAPSGATRSSAGSSDRAASASVSICSTPSRHSAARTSAIHARTLVRAIGQRPLELPPSAAESHRSASTGRPRRAWTQAAERGDRRVRLQLAGVEALEPALDGSDRGRSGRPASAIDVTSRADPVGVARRPRRARARAPLAAGLEPVGRAPVEPGTGPARALELARGAVRGTGGGSDTTRGGGRAGPGRGRPVEALELGRGVLSLEDGVAERPAHPVEHRRAPEERELLRRQLGEVLGAEVVGEVSVVAPDVHDLARAAVLVLEGERREVEARRPPLAPAQELGDIRVGQLDPGLAQQELRLAPAEREHLGAELEQPAAGPESGDRQVRLGAPGQDDRRPLRQVLDERRRRRRPNPPAAECRRCRERARSALSSRPASLPAAGPPRSRSTEPVTGGRPPRASRPDGACRALRRGG